MQREKKLLIFAGLLLEEEGQKNKSPTYRDTGVRKCVSFYRAV